MIISVDGPAGSGKSSVAEMLSKQLGFIHFNSGSLYRGITAYIIDNGLDYKKPEQFLPIKLTIRFKLNKQYVFVNGINVTKRLRDNDVSILSPTVSVIPEIRKTVDNCQRKFAKNHNVVIDGRDIGSYVFPNADIKFYLDCDINERARRRYLEEKAKNSNISLGEIKRQLDARDKTDKAKTVAPLVIPDGAIIIDSTNLTIEDEVEKMLSFINKRI